MNFSDFDSKAEQAIAAEVHMISGCADSQTSADVTNVGGDFSLPNPQGRAGGACTAALLEVLYGNGGNVSWVGALREMRTNLLNRGYDQVPQLTSSRMIDVESPFKMVNDTDSYTAVRRAVLIGINYVGQQGQLSGCHNDVLNIKKYLENEQGFESRNITVLMDDGYHTAPTRANIMNAYRQVVRESMPGDSVFCHYSGHGGRVRDYSGDEDDGYDETLIPVDFQSAGQILDDDLLKELVQPMSKGVLLTCLMDCCHSGTVLDLPYRFTADGDVSEGMQRVPNFDFDSFGVALLAGCCLGECFGCLMNIGGMFFDE